MLANSNTHELPPIRAVRDRLCVQVPWARSEEWQTRLRRAGIPSTLQLDPVSREAHLEVWPGFEENRVRAALATICG
jgi:hypothetical protein